MPSSLQPKVREMLAQQGITQLYSHQAAAFDYVAQGHHVAIVTSTASGKTFCYNLPVINTLLNQPDARALYIFPTKALAQDQLSKLNELLSSVKLDHDLITNIYDGDTPPSARQLIRNKSRILITNPDMLHIGILPHHTNWHALFQSLRFIVIDEMHTYRGVFGSHVANVIRRLKRIAAFYGAFPQFILTSATIANPGELAEKLIEEPVSIIDSDGAPQGQRHFLIYNPPLIDQQLGLRRSSLLEGSYLASEIINAGFQTILFGRTRRSIELLLTYLRERNLELPPGTLRGYRSGYLKAERREIEQGLRLGNIRAVAATSALELGIDIGDLEAAVLIGYPGSISASRQQAGRAGRKSNTALAILVTSANPLDQYLANHPEYFFERNPEQALIEPNNLPILLQHIRCAAFELPFRQEDGYGHIDKQMLKSFLKLLVQSNQLYQKGDQFYWIADQYPSSAISLRSASSDVISLIVSEFYGQKSIGQVDLYSAYWMVHPEAIYLHEGQSYYVDELNLDTGTAKLHPVLADYYTEAVSETTFEDYQAQQQVKGQGCLKMYGELTVVSQVSAYRKIRLFTHEQLGGGQVSLPPTTLNTVGYWFSIDERVVQALRDQMLWNADPNDYGPGWPKLRQQILNRDNHQCKACGVSDVFAPLHVHHIQPFKTFTSLEAANAPNNLITLCPACHRLAEQNIRIRSGLSGMAYALRNLAPLLLMCDREDIAIFSEPNSPLGEGQPTVIVYDNIQGGIGLSERLFDQHLLWLQQARDLIANCPCKDGCPSCVGPIGEEGFGGKKEALALCEALI